MNGIAVAEDWRIARSDLIEVGPAADPGSVIGHPKSEIAGPHQRSAGYRAGGLNTLAGIAPDG
jgi:hypothetical protein